MKKLLVLMLSVFILTGCSEESKDNSVVDTDLIVMQNILIDEVYNYTFKNEIDWDTGNSTKTKEFNNDILNGLLIIKDSEEDSIFNLRIEEIISKNNYSISEIKEYYTNLEVTTYNAYNMTLAYDLLDIDNYKIKSFYNTLSLNELSSWSYMTTIMALDIIGVNEVLKQELINSLKMYDESLWSGWFSVDTAADIIIALGSDADQFYYDYILESISEDNHVLNYANEASCCSLAKVIIALNKIDKFDYKYIYALDEFKTTIGYSEELNGYAEYDFSSPQAFYAITSSVEYEIRVYEN